jgi:hypothetical protein
MIRTTSFIFAFLFLIHTATARDERSIKDLTKALVALASDVDPGEAQSLSVTAHTTARRLKREYRVVLNPEFTVFLYNIGMRKRGWCGHWAQDIGAELKELKLKTLVLHWGEAYPNTTSDGEESAVRGRNHHRWLAQSGPVILVSGQKRRRVRSGTALRPLRHHDVEREHEMERVAAGVPGK